MTQTVDIVIPSFNGRELLAANLPFLVDALKTFNIEEPGKSPIRIIVVDDGSHDETAAFLTENFPFITKVTRPKQSGFSIAVNEGIAKGNGRFILCLNNDIQVTPDFLVPLLELFQDNTVFAVTSRLLIPNEEGDEPNSIKNESGHAIFFANCRLKQRRIPHEIMEKIAKPVPVSFAPGACVAYRRSTFEQLGGFDPVFAPFYWEDVDLSYRALKRGYKILYQPASIVYHKHSATINRYFIKEFVDAIFWRNLLLLNWKNLTDPSMWVKHLLSLPIETLFAVIGGRRHFLLGITNALSRIVTVAKARNREKKESVINDKELLEQFLEWEKELVKEAMHPS